MTIICLHCKVRGPGRPRKGVAGGASRVIESRRVRARTRIRGKREVTRTIQRIRQCKNPKCRYRWKTLEVTVVRR